MIRAHLVVFLALAETLAACGSDSAATGSVSPANDASWNGSIPDGAQWDVGAAPDASGLSDVAIPQKDVSSRYDVGLTTDDGATDAPVQVGDSSLVASPDGAVPAGWRLVWSDEFNGAAGTLPDSTKWGYELGGGGWGNSQLQTYTSSAQNASLDGMGNLAIVARKDSTLQYTSARINTAGKFEQTYGRFESRIRVPSGMGMWPAFWIIGGNLATAGWPQCGEADIMESLGRTPTVNAATLHGPGYSGHLGISSTYTLLGGAVFSADFHVFAAEWELNVIRFYVDSQLYATRTPADVGTNKWVYDHPFYVILNLAVGGRLPLNPDGTTVFPATMLVDYVRVYSR